MSPDDVYDRGAVVLAGASAGGVEALCRLVAGLPESFTAPILVVLHVPAKRPSALPKILARCGELPAAHAQDGEPLRAGRIYVAPPDRHLLVQDSTIVLGSGPTENGRRPSIDVLFRSAERALGTRSVAVVLTGTLDDGTEGLRRIARGGGVTIVQDPHDAQFSSMPASAVRHAEPHHVVDLASIPQLLVALSDKLADHVSPPAAQEQSEPGDHGASADEQEGALTELTCPECGGTLWETGGSFTRYRCRVGHAYSPETLVVMQSSAMEEALWAAVVALEERADLAERIAVRADRDHRHPAAARARRRAVDARSRADLLRQAVLSDQLVEVDADDS